MFDALWAGEVDGAERIAPSSSQLAMCRDYGSVPAHPDLFDVTSTTFFYTNHVDAEGMSSNVLILGQTGLEKSAWVTALVGEVFGTPKLPESERAAVLSRMVQHFDIEEEIKKSTEQATLQPYLEQANSQARLELWRRAALKTLGQAQSQGAENYIISAHGTYYRKHQFFGALCYDLIQQFGFKAIISLIDDVEDIVARVNRQRPAEGLQTGSHLTLDEALIWRSVEITVGDMLARALGVTNHVLSVKHPVSTARRLLFDPRALRVYASYPITATRQKPECVQEINAHRSYLHSNYCTFDPVTIDEWRVISDPAQPIVRGERWPLEPVTPAISPVDPAHRDSDNNNMSPELLESVSAQVASRDYRMIDQAHVVVAYRPFFGRRANMSKGVQGEMVYAVERSKTVYVFDPPEDQSRDRDASMFGVLGSANVYSTRAELYRELEKVQAAKRK